MRPIGCGYLSAPKARSFFLLLTAMSVLAGVVEVQPAVAASLPLTVIYKGQSSQAAAGTVGGFNESCPRAAPHGISGFFGVGDKAAYGQVVLSISGPLAHGWTEGVLNLSTSPEPFIAGAVCSSRSFVSRSRKIELSPNSIGGYTERCPKADPRPISGSSASANGIPADVFVAESAPAGHGWITTLVNRSAQPQTYLVGVTCAPATQRIRTLSSDVVTVPPDQTSSSNGRCGAAAPHATSGFFYPKASAQWGDVALALSGPTGPRGRVWLGAVVNLTNQPQPVVIGTICIG